MGSWNTQVRTLATTQLHRTQLLHFQCISLLIHLRKQKMAQMFGPLSPWLLASDWPALAFMAISRIKQQIFGLSTHQINFLKHK